jgi:ubiquinone/menaquinone biosynthesis C-methylase UbiE
MARKLEGHVAEEGGRAEVRRAPAEALPFPDDSFDTAVSTLALCTVADPSRALAEVRRVLKPGGRLLFVEHVRHDDARQARRQDRMDPIWRRLGHGCRCNRPTEASIRAAGFEIAEIEHGQLPKAPRFVRPLISGWATAP